LVVVVDLAVVEHVADDEADVIVCDTSSDVLTVTTTSSSAVIKSVDAERCILSDRLTYVLCLYTHIFAVFLAMVSSWVSQTKAGAE
jgi:ABC-type sulfate transport system permease component